MKLFFVKKLKEQFLFLFESTKHYSSQHLLQIKLEYKIMTLF